MNRMQLLADITESAARIKPAKARHRSMRAEMAKRAREGSGAHAPKPGR